eukprot:TRINITY_DN13178_c0_g1_i1.p1 TRINITY_DN13178_c0_g1~~TRINITY_DN13178_c0_g1_i1.p1  ORF type:complete len:558 (+),score=128.89 TRINITY_DN13178_c0_g1_i1:73-1674(+)
MSFRSETGGAAKSVTFSDCPEEVGGVARSVNFSDLHEGGVSKSVNLSGIVLGADVPGDSASETTDDHAEEDSLLHQKTYKSKTSASRVSVVTHSVAESDKYSIAEYFRAHPKKLRAAIALLVSFGLAYVNVSAPIPFLADCLKKHDIDDVAVGCIYSAHPFGIAVITLFTERVERLIGNRPMLILGFVVAGAATIISAFAFELVGSDKTVLLVVMVLLRFLQGSGEGLADTAVMNYYQILFPEVLGQVLGLSEGMIGLGYALGPLLGGLLYDVSGWALPYFVVGVPFFILAIITPALIAPAEEEARALAGESDCEDSGEINHPVVEKSVGITAITAIGIMINTLSIGAVMTVLSEQLEDFYNLSSTVCGVIIGASGLVYWVAGYYIGRSCDKCARMGDHRGMHFLHGYIVMIIGFILLGPVPLPDSWDDALDMNNKTVQFIIVMIGLTVGTVSTAITVIGGMSILTVRARSTAQASALFHGSLNMGYALGPIVVSAIKSHYNYRASMASCAALGTVYYMIAFLLLRCGYDMTQ